MKDIPDLKHWEEPRLSQHERQLSLESMRYVWSEQRRQEEHEAPEVRQ